MIKNMVYGIWPILQMFKTLKVYKANIYLKLYIIYTFYLRINSAARNILKQTLPRRGKV